MLDRDDLVPYIDALYARLSRYPLDGVSFVRKDEYTILTNLDDAKRAPTRETWGEIIIDLQRSLDGEIGIVTRICGGNQLPESQGTVSVRDLDTNLAWCESVIRLIEALRLAVNVSKMVQRELTQETP